MASNLACSVDHRPVGLDRQHAQAVDLLELGFLGLGGTGHAGQLVVHPEVVLQRDRGEGLVLILDLDVFLGLQGLVQALVVAPADQGAPGVLVDDQHLAVENDVVLVALEQLLGLDRVVQVGDERGVGALVEVLDAEPVLYSRNARFEYRDRPLLLVHLVVEIALQPLHKLGELGIPGRVVLGRAGDDQRGAGLVDQDGVDLVDDRVVVAPLHAVVQRERHIVAQVVEAELVVGAVGDVGGVGGLPLGRRHLRQDRADAQAQEMMDAAHLLGLELGQVVVHRHDVDALAVQRVQVGGHHTDQGLALTGLHLGDVAPVQGRGALNLDVEVPLAQHPPARLPDGGEGLGHQLVQRFAVLAALPQLRGLALQFLVRHLEVVALDRIDLDGHRLELLEGTTLTHVQQLVE